MISEVGGEQAICLDITDGNVDLHASAAVLVLSADDLQI